MIIIIIVITKIKTIKEKKDLIRTVEWNKMISSFVILSLYSNAMIQANQLKFSVYKLSAYRSCSNTNLLITLSSFISYILSFICLWVTSSQKTSWTFLFYLPSRFSCLRMLTLISTNTKELSKNWCFLVNFAKSLRAPFLQSISGGCFYFSIRILRHSLKKNSV